jgi:hypothetical protein
MTNPLDRFELFHLKSGADPLLELAKPRKNGNLRNPKDLPKLVDGIRKVLRGDPTLTEFVLVNSFEVDVNGVTCQ